MAKKKKQNKKKPGKNLFAPKTLLVNKSSVAGAVAKHKKLNSREQRKIEDIWAMFEEQEFEEAEEILQELVIKHPNHIDVLDAAVGLYTRAIDHPRLLIYAQKLFKIKSRDIHLHYTFANALLFNDFDALALEEYLILQKQKNVPSDLFEEIEEKIAVLNKAVFERAKNSFGNILNARTLLINFDLQRMELQDENYQRVIELGDKLIEAAPKFMPAYNNAIIAAYQLADFDKVRNYLDAVFELDPKNIFAYSFKLRLDYLYGINLERSSVLDQPSKFYLHKQLECLLYFEDYQRIVGLFKLGVDHQSGQVQDMIRACEMASFAYFVLGDFQAAREVWTSFPKDLGHNFIVNKNILELEQAEKGQVDAPYVLSAHEIFPKAILNILVSKAKSRNFITANGGMDSRRVLAKFPFLPGLVRLMIKFSDASGLTLAEILIVNLKSEGLFEELKSFAIGRRLSDELRSKLTTSLSREGYWPARTEFWRNGEKIEIESSQTEIYFESEQVIRPGLMKYFKKIAKSLNFGEFAKAESLCQQALILDPDHPTLMNNLAIAYHGQGKEEKAKKLMLEICEKHPEYFFSHTAQVNMLIEEKDFVEARKQIAKLAQRPRLHIAELVAVQTLTLRLAMAEENYDTAVEQINFIEEIAYEGTNWRYIDYCEQIIDSAMEK